MFYCPNCRIKFISHPNCLSSSSFCKLFFTKLILPHIRFICTHKPSWTIYNSSEDHFQTLKQYLLLFHLEHHNLELRNKHLALFFLKPEAHEDMSHLLRLIHYYTHVLRISSFPHSFTSFATFSYIFSPSFNSKSCNSPEDLFEVLTSTNIPFPYFLQSSTNGLTPSVPRYGFTVTKSKSNMPVFYISYLSFPNSCIWITFSCCTYISSF